MTRSLDPRWHSKESLLASIGELAATSGWAVQRLGSGDTFEITGENRSSIIIALKESGKEQPADRERHHHWIGVPDAFLKRFIKLLEMKMLGNLMFFLIDHWDQHLVVIPGGPALGTIFNRDQKGADPHLSFNVKKTAGGYSLVTARGQPEVNLQHVDTLWPLKELLQRTQCCSTRGD